MNSGARDAAQTGHKLLCVLGPWLCFCVNRAVVVFSCGTPCCMSDCLCAISGPGLCVYVDLAMVATEKTSKPWEPSPYYLRPRTIKKK